MEHGLVMNSAVPSSVVRRRRKWNRCRRKQLCSHFR